jgi:two-component system, NarL family, sensor histidine kinase UhpB
MDAGVTLNARLSLMISALLAAVTLAGGAYIIHKARSDIHDETASTLALTRHFFDAQIGALEEKWSTQGFSAPALHLQDLGDVRHLTVRLYDTGGKVLDSNDDPHKVSAAPAWFDSLIRAAGSRVSAEVLPLEFNGEGVGRIVIAPDPSYETDEMWTTSGGLLGLLLSFFVLVNGLVWWAATRALKPVERILRGLSELRAGHLSERLPHFGLPELSRISVGFNHMAESLEQSIMENQRLTRRLIEAQERERNSIALELHDEIGQCVSAIHADAAAIRNRGDAAVRESAEAIAAVTSHLKNIVKSMLHRLRPPLIEGVGLGPALRDLVASFQQRNPQTHCALKVSAELGELEDKVSVAVYRIIQECLTNIAVHAAAQNASVSVSLIGAQERIKIAVRDDGVGFSTAVGQGLGLTGIKERVGDLGGSFHIEAQPGKGTCLELEIPLSAEEVLVP